MNNAQPKNENEIPESIVHFIGEHHVLTLSTSVNEDLWCAHCFYVFLPQHRCFIFSSDSKTKHMQQVCHNSFVAASIVLESSVVGVLRGLQIQGSVFQLLPTIANEAKKAYCKRFPVANLMDLHLWQLDVTYLKFTDNRLGFGKKIIWTRDTDFFEKWNAIQQNQ